MHRFESYLISLGYTGYDFVNGKHCKLNRLYPSSMGCLSLAYYKTNVIGKKCSEIDETPVIFGLYQHGNPPTLISPRPHSLKKDGYSIVSDAEMSGILNKFTDEEIYNALNIEITNC